MASAEPPRLAARGPSAEALGIWYTPHLPERSGAVERTVPSYQPPYICVATVPALLAWIFSSHVPAISRPASLSFFTVSRAVTQAGWFTVTDWPSAAK